MGGDLVKKKMLLKGFYVQWLNYVWKSETGNDSEKTL